MDGSSKNFRWHIKLPKGERSRVNEKLLTILKKMISENYFDTPKYALRVYLDLRMKFNNKFTALELQIALAKLCNIKSDPIFALKTGKDNMRTV